MLPAPKCRPKKEMFIQVTSTFSISIYPAPPHTQFHLKTAQSHEYLLFNIILKQSLYFQMSVEQVCLFTFKMHNRQLFEVLWIYINTNHQKKHQL